MKGIRIGRRRGRDNDVALSPLELALRPAIVEGRWQVPDHFNFTRDVLEALARDPKRRALTSLGKEGVIEHRNFYEIADGAAIWATRLRESGITPGDRVLVVSGTTVDWLEIVLGALKVGAVVAPSLADVSSSMLERLVSSTDAALVVAERSLEPTIERMGFTPDVYLYDEGEPRSSKDVPVAATHDTASRDLAFIVSTTGVGGTRKDVAHTHGSVFATRVQAEHWLDVGRGDAVWCTTDAASPLTMWNTVVGPWSRGAEVVVHEGAFDVDERLDLLFRLGPSILCQSPAEYRALAEHRRLERFRSPRLRRLVSTGDFLDPEVVATFEERWGMTIYDGYGQAETNIVIANLADGAAQPGTIGRALPGHHVAIIDDQGNELPAGIEGDLAVRGRPPTLFAGYWELPEETKSAFLGDWYLTGDVAQADEDGVFTFVGRAEDVITSNGRTFGPFDVERVLGGHAAIATAAVVGIRDLQRGGHFVRAFVVPRRGAEGSEQLEAELREYVAQTLPAQQVPREIVFVDELPTTSMKVSRHALRERPLEGRPLWDTPPTSEPEMEAAPPLPPIDSEFAPRVDRGLEVPPAIAVAPPHAAPATPEPAPPTPVEAIVAPEPVVEPPAPTPEPPAEAVAAGPSAEAARVAEPAPVEVAELVEPEPASEPEPAVEPASALEALPVVEPDPEPDSEPVAEVAALDPSAEAGPVLEPEPVETAQPEPVREPEPVVGFTSEPEPVLEAAPVFEPVPEPDPAPVAEVFAPEPVADPAPVVEPEPVEIVEPEHVVEILPEPVAEARPAIELEPEPEPERESVVDVEREPVLEAATELAPEQVRDIEPATVPEPEEVEPATPTLVVLPEPEHMPEPEHRPEFSVAAEPEALPDFVIDEPDGPPPVVLPEPEPDPEPGPLPDFVVDEPNGPPPVVLPESEPDPEPGPLPDFVVEPGSTPEPPPAPPAPSALEPEEEVDLGPLPDYVIDPSLPEELRPAPPPRPTPVEPPPAASLQVPTSAKPDATMSNASAAGVYFPPTTAFPIRRDDDEEPARPKKPQRRRPPAELGSSKGSAQPADPGDEGGEVGWMAGLSNRLSAYSLADEDPDAAGEPGSAETPDDEAKS